MSSFYISSLHIYHSVVAHRCTIHRNPAIEALFFIKSTGFVISWHASRDDAKHYKDLSQRQDSGTEQNDPSTFQESRHPQRNSEGPLSPVF